MEIVPFGKYKGQPVEVLANDRGYCDWLMSQGEFMDRFPQVKTLIVNNFKEPEDTPDHNRLQGLFLDESFCRSFAERLLSIDNSSRQKEYREVFPKIKSKALDRLAEAREHIEYESDISAKISAADAVISEDWPNTEINNLAFERNGVDVSFIYNNFYKTTYFEGFSVYHCSYETNVLAHNTSPSCVGSDLRDYNISLRIEVKPSVGDDFPSIMRQMKSNECNTLFYTEYTGQGLTEEQMRKMMKIENIDTIRLDEIQ